MNIVIISTAILVYQYHQCCFVNSPVITTIEFMNIEMYISVQQIHIRLFLFIYLLISLTSKLLQQQWKWKLNDWKRLEQQDLEGRERLYYRPNYNSLLIFV